MLDLNDNPFINDKFVINMLGPYGNCQMVDAIPVKNGLFNTTIPLISDGRSFYVKFSFTQSGYQTDENTLFVD